jgi:hypothetical protein
VQVFDSKGKKIDKKKVANLLKKEKVALASMGGQKVDPLHFRVIKEGTLVMVLPAPKGLPGGGGIRGGGGIVVPAVPAVPALPPGPPNVPGIAPPPAGAPGGFGGGAPAPGIPS